MKRTTTYLSPPSSSPKLACPICGGESNEIPLHFYKHRRCQSCQHCFVSESKKAALKNYHNLHLRKMRANGEFLQQTITQNHFQRLEVMSEEKKSLLDMLSPSAKSILDLESETGCFEKEEATCLTQIPHLKRHLRTSTYGSILQTDDKYDVIISHRHLEYEEDPIAIAPYIMSRLKKDGSWVICLPIDNNVENNYLGRLHEFSNDSSIIFASALSYSFASVNMNDSIVLVIK